jgi:hypothetical protein
MFKSNLKWQEDLFDLKNNVPVCLHKKNPKPANQGHQPFHLIYTSVVLEIHLL